MSFETEQESKDYFCKVLQQYGYTNIKQTTYRYEYYDIEAEYNNIRYRFELKVRNFPSTKYNDSMMELHKYQKFVEDYQNKQFDKGVLVSLFEDCMTLSDVLHPRDSIYRIAPNSMDLVHFYKKKKNFIIYNQEKKIAYV